MSSGSPALQQPGGEPAPAREVRTASAGDALVACPGCDAIHRLPVARPAPVRCQRCGATLAGAAAGLEVPLALALAGVPALILASTSALLELHDGGGAPVRATVLSAMDAFAEQRLPGLAVLVLVTALLLPGLRLAVNLHLLLFARRGRRAPGLRLAIDFLGGSAPLAQTEILLLGVLVALVKLTSVFPVVPGVGLGALGALVLIEQGLSRLLDHRALWQLGAGDHQAVPGAAPGAGGRGDPGPGSAWTAA